MLEALDLTRIAGERWYRHKLTNPGAAGAHVVDWAALEPGDLGYPLLLVVVKVDAAGRYFLPIVASHHDHGGFGVLGPGSVEVTVDECAGSELEGRPRVQLGDAASTGTYANYILRLIDEGMTIPSEKGTFVFRRLGKPTWNATTGSDAYSNSMVFADASVALKTFRLLAGGVNPEVEIGQALAQHTRFHETARALGYVSYIDCDGIEQSIAMVSQRVDNKGDAWSCISENLSEALNTGALTGAATPRAIRELGGTIARLHFALASVPEAGFRCRPAGTGDVARWVSSYHSRADEAMGTLNVALEHGLISDELLPLSERVLNHVPCYLGVSPLERNLGADFGSVIRCHGDLHLGQILMAKDGGHAVIDFEGEPLAPLATRRSLTSPARDLAGMLRSFSYAARSVSRRAGASRDDQALLANWEHAACEAFLSGYSDELRRCGIELLPREPEATMLLCHFSAEKAFYELTYELNNRPDWAGIPLSGLIALADQWGGGSN